MNLIMPGFNWSKLVQPNNLNDVEISSSMTARNTHENSQSSFGHTDVAEQD